MAFLEFLPDELLNPNKKSEVIEYIKSLGLTIEDKKFMLSEWLEEMNLSKNKEDFAKLY